MTLQLLVLSQRGNLGEDQAEGAGSTEQLSCDCTQILDQEVFHSAGDE